MEYIKGRKRPRVDCIICGIRDNIPDVSKLEVLRTKLSIVSVNLYPYNTGHLLIFPKRHLTDLRELTDEESQDIDNVTKVCFDVCDELYQPIGYNIGYNMGKGSGASIDHLHRHIVPRYNNEIGFISIIGGAKLVVEDPNITLKRIQECMEKHKHKLNME